MAASRRRNVHLGEKIWQYAIGKGSICFWSPEGSKIVVRVHDFLGWSPFEFEKACWKGSRPPITPADIKAYIEKNLS